MRFGRQERRQAENMGKAKNELKDFIANIPNAKLTGFPSSETTIYKTSNLRLDMQTVRTINSHLI